MEAFELVGRDIVEIQLGAEPTGQFGAPFWMPPQNPGGGVA
jgi:hypothetical protein